MAMSVLNLGKVIVWYLGVQENSDELERILNSNSHTMLINDNKQREKFISYTNTSIIPHKYKSGKNYENYEIEIKNSNLKILENYENISSIMSQVFLPGISPGLADSENLIG